METRDEMCDRLLARIGSGDREAFAGLFASEAARLIAIAKRIVRRRDLAEEIVQDSFIAAWKSAPSFDPLRGRARAWLTTMVRNRALNVLRDSARIDYVTPVDIEAFRDRGPEAESAYRALADGDALKRCLERLEERSRRSILLAYVLGYSHGEIAAELRAPLGTVKAWIRRGVIALQECLS